MFLMSRNWIGVQQHEVGPMTCGDASGCVGESHIAGWIDGGGSERFER